MASKELFPDMVNSFATDWYAFEGMLDPDEREDWNVLVERVKNRPYPGACQLSEGDDPKWSIVFTMLVTQQAEIRRSSAPGRSVAARVVAIELRVVSVSSLSPIGQ